MAVWWGWRRSRRRRSFLYVDATAHKVDEAVTLDDLNRLSTIYRRIPERYFADPPCPA